MGQIDAEIKEERCNEYEFDNYSLVHVLDTDRWELHFYDEEQGELYICIEDTSFTEEEDLFSQLGFTEEIFNRILKFEETK